MPLPSAAVQVIVAEPLFTAVTLPLLTVATEVLLLDHVTFLFVALLGETVALTVAELPLRRESFVLLRTMLVTGILGVLILK